MNRRGFLGTLLAAPVAALPIPAGDAPLRYRCTERFVRGYTSPEFAQEWVARYSHKVVSLDFEITEDEFE